ncbi:MAG: isoprenyl transferase [Firmicutes bacterium]|nr:isoprenyl transferase [Bacillota bacterium]
MSVPREPSLESKAGATPSRTRGLFSRPGRRGRPLRFFCPIQPRSREESLRRRVDPGRLPRHIAIIMDGNGRWASRRGLPRTFGHRAGVESLRRVVELCAELGIPVLTVFAFSTENWKRPQEEVNVLMDLLVEYLHREAHELERNGIRVCAIGRLDELPAPARGAVREITARTAKNERMVLNLALNYGGRTELVDAARRLAAEVLDGSLRVEEIDESRMAEALYTAGLPDPDLVIRPSGEMRISNFLLWQVAYAELWVTPVLWPDFRRVHLLEAILDYQRRERRFGGLKQDS